MSPGHGKLTMSDITLTLNSNSQNLAIPKLRDDGSNWADYEPRAKKAMGAKGVCRLVEGTALMPKPFNKVNGDYVTSDGKTPATEEQIEARDAKIDEYEKKEFLAQHIIMSTTSPRLGVKIKNLKTAKEMWDAVKQDATTKSTLYIVDAEDELSSMRCNDSAEAKTHLAKLKDHFNLMLQRRDNLAGMGSALSDTHFSAMIMSSLPPSYRPALQTISAASKANKTVTMSPADLITFFTEEAQHWVIEEDRVKQAESALYSHGGKDKKSWASSRNKRKKSDVKCKNPNCKKLEHTKADCWAKGGDKEGQGPRQKNSKKGEKKSAESVNVAEGEEMFAFTCTSDFTAVADALQSRSRSTEQLTVALVVISVPTGHDSPTTEQSKIPQFTPPMVILSVGLELVTFG
jgi:hypothetical protein